MLARTTFPADYLAAVRGRIADQVGAWSTLSKPTPDLETAYFNNLVLVLELAFVHRLRGKEGKDGNPMNEVRLLASSLLENDGVLLADKQIRLDPATSVLGLAVGDRIALTQEDFTRLSAAYLDAVAATFGE